jgi:hypothetical protein
VLGGVGLRIALFKKIGSAIAMKCLLDEQRSMDEITKEFLIESNELLDQLDRDLADLEKDGSRRSCWPEYSAPLTPSKARAGPWVFPNWNRWPMLGKTIQTLRGAEENRILLRAGELR